MPGPATANDYTVLGLRPSATMADVETAFQQLALVHHPNRSSDPRAAERFAALQQSYERIRAGGHNRIYHVGDPQPDDDDPAPSGDFVPFDQAKWTPAVVPAATTWGRISAALVWVQLGGGVACLLTAFGFWISSSFPDQSRIELYQRSPLCSAHQTPDCITGPLSAIVDGTLNEGGTTLFGDYTDGLRLHVGPGDIDVGISRADGAGPYSGIQADDTVVVTSWHGSVVGVATQSAVLTTDATPTVIQARHRTAMWLWLIGGLALIVRPLIHLARRRRERDVD